VCDLILDDETGPDDDEISLSVEDWLRFNHQPKFTDRIRDRLRVFRFLRKPPAVSALHERQAAFSDTARRHRMADLSRAPAPG